MYRIAAYVASGLVTTAVGYVAFMLFLRALPYQAANAAGWLLTVALGFALNRRFTFGLRGAQGRGGQFLRHFVGAVLQLGVSAASLHVLMGELKWSPTPAYLLTLIFTTVFGFTYLNLVTFRAATPRAISTADQHYGP